MAPRVLYFITDLESGLGRSLLNAVERLSGPYEFLVCELSSRDSVIGQAIARLGIEVVPIGKRGTDPRVPWDLLHVARRFRPHLTQGFQLETNFYAWMAGRLLRARMVAGFHGLVTPFRRTMRPFLWSVLKGADAISCVSRAAARLCIESHPGAASRVVVIPNGVDASAFSTAPRRAPRDGCLTITCVADFHSRVKGHAHLVHAMRSLEEHEARLWIVGDGPLLDETRTLARDLGVDRRVRFWGRRQDVARILADSDVFVLPSLSESCPHALLEAMAAGVPAVATEVGGVPEIVMNRRTGLLVPPEDPAAIAGAVRELSRDPRLYEELSERAWHHVRECFDVDSAARRTGELYGRLLARS